MPNDAWAYRYDSHGLWSQLDSSRYALANAGTQENEAAELNRQQMVAALSAASAARSALGPFVTLAELDAALNQVATYFSVDAPTQNLASQQIVAQVLQHLRVLPAPLPKAAASAVSSSVAALRRITERDVEELEAQVAELSARTVDAEARLESLSSAASEQRSLIAGESARLQQTVASANARFDSEIELVRSEWATKRDEQERKLNADAEKEIALLASVAELGRRLVAHAAGRFTSASWQERASRDRRAANYLFALGLVVFVLTGALAYMFIQEVSRQTAVDQFSVGESLFRISLVGTLGAAIAYLFAESGRRRREANSAEEVATVLNTVEAFTANASSGEQEALAREISRMVFVENIRSRLSSRDAVRGGPNSDATVEQLLELASNLAKRAPR